jgi:hypothetical protein
MSDSGHVSESAKVEAHTAAGDQTRMSDQDECSGCGHVRGVHLDPGTQQQPQCVGEAQSTLPPQFCTCEGFKQAAAGRPLI